MTSVLIIPLRFIGDAVLTLGLLDLLHQQRPDLNIDLLLTPHLLNLFDTHPGIRRVYTQKSQLSAGHYDISILMRNSLSDVFLTAFTLKIPMRIGFDAQRLVLPYLRPRFGLGLTHRVRFPELRTRTPQLIHYLTLLQPLIDEGALAALHTIQSPVSPDDREWAHQQLAKNKPVAAIHISSASTEKAMDASFFIPALQYLQAAGYALLALGSQQDYGEIEAIALRETLSLQNMCGKSSLRQSIALLEQVTLLISLDSGPVHLAALAHTPHLIVVYGPTNPDQWRPYPYTGKFTAVLNHKLTCRPCPAKTCSHNACRTELFPQALLEALNAHGL
jgi:ADP-heptose:LPS heptosyltransferase